MSPNGKKSFVVFSCKLTVKGYLRRKQRRVSRTSHISGVRMSAAVQVVSNIVAQYRFTKNAVKPKNRCLDNFLDLISIAFATKDLTTTLAIIDIVKYLEF